jgi:hypothetical protein
MLPLELSASADLCLSALTIIIDRFTSALCSFRIVFGVAVDSALSRLSSFELMCATKGMVFNASGGEDELAGGPEEEDVRDFCGDERLSAKDGVVIGA